MIGVDFKISAKGKSMQQIVADIKADTATLFKGIELAGTTVKNHMIDVINSQKVIKDAPHETSEKLADSINKHSTVQKTPGSIFIGIGNISGLDQDSPHHEFVNSGVAGTGTKLPAQGKFVPGYWSGNVFHYRPYNAGDSAENKTGMVPKADIFTKSGSPLHYKEAGQERMRREIAALLERARRRVV